MSDTDDMLGTIDAALVPQAGIGAAASGNTILGMHNGDDQPKASNDDLTPAAGTQADDSPLIGANTRVSVGHSLEALARAADPDEGPRPGRSDASADEGSVRPLSEIERDLRAAEAQFADAEARRQQAEADRQAALGGIDQYQEEIDAAINLLRQNSPAGSMWSRAPLPASTVLTLKDEVPAKGSDPAIRPAFGFGQKG